MHPIDFEIRDFIQPKNKHNIESFFTNFKKEVNNTYKTLKNNIYYINKIEEYLEWYRCKSYSSLSLDKFLFLGNISTVLLSIEFLNRREKNSKN